MFVLKLKDIFKAPLTRAHLCTLAAALSFNSTWRVPREGFRYGGLQYGLLLTITLVVVALPASLLQLATGQLSQQDAVGVWRAVPFFRGVGYLRLFISFIGSIYTIIYLALSVSYFFYSLNNAIPFWDCPELDQMLEDTGEAVNVTCPEGSFLAPVNEQPEYYASLALIIIVLWFLLPFLLFSPAKYMKRQFFVLGPLILLLCIIILSCIGDKQDLHLMHNSSDWNHLLEPKIWHAAVVQALVSTQAAGGYLPASGDTVYSSCNVIWTAVTIVVANIVASWFGLLFWYGISGPEKKDTTPIGVLVQMYNVAVFKDLDQVWPVMVFIMFMLSGCVTMLTLLFPLYDRFRRVGKHRWRRVSMGNSLFSIAVTLVVLIWRLEALELLEDTVVPLMISLITVLEIGAFISIYGWKVLANDIDFLTGGKLQKYWRYSWLAVLIVIILFTTWWMTMVFLMSEGWKVPPWEACGVVTTAGFVVVVLITCACVAIARQVQYDFVGKLRSSFVPSRHWGPRDPITHYYWLARREDPDGQTGVRYNRRQVEQISSNVSVLDLNISECSKYIEVEKEKIRSSSDDFLYTRKKIVEESLEVGKRRRTKSLDWSLSFKEVDLKPVTPDIVSYRTVVSVSTEHDKHL